MFTAYIVDDELIVRQGLKSIIDWSELGFKVCGEAGDGLTAYAEIMDLEPDLVLADIRMPKLSGLALARKLREGGFTGRIIILSGYSDFEYAQEAISYDVDYYLTKPIDREELKNAVAAIHKKLEEQLLESKHKSYFQEKAKFKILEEILKSQSTGLPLADSTLKELSLDADEYQVLILDKLEADCDVYADFCSELGIGKESDSLERYSEETGEIILLKGRPIIAKFAEYTEDQAAETRRPFIVIAGKTVSDVQEIYASYQEAELIRERNFFAREKRFILERSAVAKLLNSSDVIALGDPSAVGRSLYECIIVHQQYECDRILDRLRDNLARSSSEIREIKNFLAGVLIYIVQGFRKDYAENGLSFATSAEIIKAVEGKRYLTDILAYIRVEIERMIESLTSLSGDGVLEAVYNYINHHYAEDIKLKTIARKFGYNSSYLGRIFTQKYKISFNDYLHQVRIEKAMELLRSEDYKIYEIAGLVGYSNVDYFHVKFREYVGTTPAKFKKG